MRHPEREIDRPEKAPDAGELGSGGRQEYRGRDRSYRLSDQELTTLRTVGTFRTVNAKDIPGAGSEAPHFCRSDSKEHASPQRLDES